MVTENEALVVIEEGNDPEVKADQFGCCWSVFAFTLGV